MIERLLISNGAAPNAVDANRRIVTRMFAHDDPLYADTEHLIRTLRQTYDRLVTNSEQYSRPDTRASRVDLFFISEWNREVNSGGNERLFRLRHTTHDDDDSNKPRHETTNDAAVSLIRRRLADELIAHLTISEMDYFVSQLNTTQRQELRRRLSESDTNERVIELE